MNVPKLDTDRTVLHELFKYNNNMCLLGYQGKDTQ